MSVADVEPAGVTRGHRNRNLVATGPDADRRTGVAPDAGPMSAAGPSSVGTTAIGTLGPAVLISTYSTIVRRRATAWARVRRMPGRGLVLALLAALAAGAAAAPDASAHLRSGTLAVDYRVSLRDASAPAYDARIYQSDHGLTLTVRPGHVVVLVGYLGEPVFRLDGRGLSINAASPTAVAVRLLGKQAAVDASVPVWRTQAGRRTATWHDARAQGLPSGVSSGIWRVPLIVDGRHIRLEGELRRYGRPLVWVWLVVLALWLAAGGALLTTGRLPGQRAAAVFALMGAAAATLTTIGFALDAYASPGTWILSFDAIAFLVAGVAVLLRGPEHLRAVGAIGTGLVALAIGLFTIPVFLHPIVLSTLPGTLTRVLAAATIGSGLDAAALGGRLYTDRAAASARAEPEVWPLL
jgi:hypothetical protein